MQAISDFICQSDSRRSNITVNTSVYSLEAIHAATYKYSGSYHILITPSTDATVIIIFEAKDRAMDISEDMKDFANSLIDHQVRLQLDKSNGKIRDLIVAHAFSPLDLKKETKAL